jgi:hypothetical protein
VTVFNHKEAGRVNRVAQAFPILFHRAGILPNAVAHLTDDTAENARELTGSFNIGGDLHGTYSPFIDDLTNLQIYYNIICQKSK